MFLKDHEYNYLKECKKGVYDSDPMVAEFRAFFISEFGVHLYGYICDKTEGSSGLNRLRYFVDADSRNVFIDTVEGYGNRDRIKEKKIKAKFSELCAKYGLNDAFLEPDNYFAIHDEFESEMKQEIMNACAEDIKKYLETVEEIKLVDIAFNSVFIFFECDEHVALYEASGLSKEISEHVYSLIKEKDYLDVFKNPQVVFDSLQTLNDKFEGNLINYHR